jgi:hypothetical protein
VSTLATELRAMGVDALDSPQGFVTIRGHRIVLGRRAGEAVDVALSGLDYPLTPPAGVHIRATWGADRPNVMASPLGSDWRYWSRRLSEWRGLNSPHSIIAYVNRILADA